MWIERNTPLKRDRYCFSFCFKGDELIVKNLFVRRKLRKDFNSNFQPEEKIDLKLSELPEDVRNEFKERFIVLMLFVFEDKSK